MPKLLLKASRLRKIDMKWPSRLRYIDICQSAGPSPRPIFSRCVHLSLKYMWKVDFASVFAVRTHLMQCLFACLTPFAICSSWKWMKWTSYATLSIGLAFGSSTLLRCIANTESKSSCQAQSTDICQSGGPSARHIFTLHLDFPWFFRSSAIFCVMSCDVVWCGVMSCDVMWYGVMRCDVV